MVWAYLEVGFLAVCWLIALALLFGRHMASWLD